MEQKLSKYSQQLSHFIERFQDARFTGQVVFVCIVLMISWSGVKAIQSNYMLQKKITALQQQNSLQQLSNNNLQLENEYYNTDTYQELSARQNFSLALPGEKEIIVPKDVALGYTTPLPKTDSSTKANSKAPLYQQNIQAWVDFFLHRQQSED